MATLTASTDYFPEPTQAFPSWLEAIRTAFDNVTVTQQSQLDSLFDGNFSRVDAALDIDPTAISSTSITWALNGARVVLSGAGFGSFSTLGELEVAIEAAIDAALNGNGAASTGDLNGLVLDTFTFSYNNVTALTVGLSASGINVTSGALEFDLVGAGPGDLNGLLDLIVTATNVADLDQPTNAELDAAWDLLLAELQGVGFSSFTISDGATQLLGLSLSDSQILLTSGTTEIEVNGVFPDNNLNQIMNLILQVDEAEENGTPITNLNQLAGLGLNNVIVRDGGVEVLRFAGQFSDEASFGLTSAVITGTDGDDYVYSEDYGVEDHGSVTISLGAGNDELLEATDWRHFTENSVGVQTLLDGGAGDHDLLNLSDRADYGVAGQPFYDNFFDLGFYYVPDDRVIAVDLAAGTLSATLEQPYRQGEAPYSVDLAGFEDVHFDVDGAFSFVGNAANNTVSLGYVNELFYDAPFMLDGGAGAGDVLDLTGLQLSGSSFIGIDYEGFNSAFDVSRAADGSTTLALDSRGIDLELRNFETIRFVEAGGIGTRDIAVSDLQIEGLERQGTGTANNLLGTLDSDTLVGNGDQDTLVGGGGDDLLIGGNPNALSNAAGGDTFIGGEGRDAVSYAGSFGSLRVDLQFSHINTFAAAGDTYDSIEDIIGSQGADNIRGNQEDNGLIGGRNVDYIFGRRGEDTLEGGIGDDVLFGGVGEDVLSGGTHRDRAQYSESLTAVRLDLADSSRNTGEAIGDTYASIEDLAGSRFDDTISGDDGGNRLFGREGNDYLDGREGADYLNGGGGQDTLIGGAGNDTLRGGTSRDTFVFEEGMDVVEDWFLDHIELDRGLWGGADLSASDITSTYATVVNGDVVFDFGSGNMLTLQGQTDIAALETYIFDV